MSGRIQCARELPPTRISVQPCPVGVHPVQGWHAIGVCHTAGATRRDRIAEDATDLGHHFRWLHTGTAAYDAMVAMIDGALATVDVEFYTIAPGLVTERLGEALRRAAVRGVRVRVLIDAFGSSALPRAVDRASAHDGRRRPSIQSPTAAAVVLPRPPQAARLRRADRHRRRLQRGAGVRRATE